MCLIALNVVKVVLTVMPIQIYRGVKAIQWRINFLFKKRS